MIDRIPEDLGRARDAAQERLREAWAQGRLDADEHERRATALRHAASTAEIEAIERGDLRGVGGGVHTGGGMQRIEPGGSTEATGTGTEESERTGGVLSLSGKTGATVMSLTPFVALILFFSVGGMGLFPAWLWFLMIPIVAIVVHGPGDDDDEDDDGGK